MHDQRCHGIFLGSMLKLARTIPFDFITVCGDCFIDHARHELVTHFMSGSWELLAFIDDDIGFEIEGFVKMLNYARTPEFPIIGAACPKRQFNMKKMRESAIKGEDEETMQYRATDWNYNLPVGTEFEVAKPLEVDSIGTGIMIVRREVFEKLQAPYFNSHWKQNGKGPEYIGEDVDFCTRWKQTGGKVWMAPWVLTMHMGTMAYPGDIRRANLSY